MKTHPARSSKRNVPTDLDIARGKRIASARHARKLTQEALSHLVGCTPGLVGQWEKGLTGLTSGFAAKLEKALDVPMDWLLRGNDPELKRIAQTTTEQAQLDVIRTVPVERQGEFVTIMRNIAAAMKK